jgi:L-alanine-DL-glutamate epimerase-like enolase superfamily enzyme
VFTLPFHEALQVALWDLAAQEVKLPLHKLLGSRRDRVEAYASGLDFHLSDDEFARFFAHADAIGYRAFKIKVGSPDFDWDLNRLKILKQVVRKDALVMIDANEAWGAKEALVKLTAIRDAGHELLWVEDPILRNDHLGLKMLKDAASWTLINSGEYLDAHGKRLLMEADATDILNVHGQVTDVMRIGWLAADRGIPVSLGNTFLEVGIHMACALPEVQWLEYSFQNFDHLVDRPVEILDGWAYAPDRPGHGLVLNETTRRDWARPTLLPRSELGEAPHNPRVGNSQRAA